MTRVSVWLGIDIGGTKIAGGLVGRDGRVTVRDECPTPAALGGAQVLRAALALAGGLGQRAPAGALQAAGIGTGGQVDARRGLIVSATDLLPGWAGTPVGDAFRAGLGVPAQVDNDVNALAIGEYRFGAARGQDTVVFLALGTGVGGALLLGGRLHHGAHWSGAEFGHILLNVPGRGGDRSTLEDYVSGAGLVQTWRELGGDAGPAAATAREIAAGAQRDPAGPAARAIARTGDRLGWGLVSLANALDPDLIVIGGGLAGLGDALLAPARAVLQAHALPGPARCPVVAAALGPDAGLIGAAALAMPAA